MHAFLCYCDVSCCAMQPPNICHCITLLRGRNHWRLLLACLALGCRVMRMQQRLSILVQWLANLAKHSRANPVAHLNAATPMLQQQGRHQWPRAQHCYGYMVHCSTSTASTPDISSHSSNSCHSSNRPSLKWLVLTSSVLACTCLLQLMCSTHP